MSNRSKIAYVDGRRLRRAVLAACDHGQLIKAELNRINVFPVADGDTGTNLALTLDAVASGLAGSREKRVDHVAAAVARSALVGARGNCGMMLSQFLLGFAGELEGRVRASLTDIASALRAGARSLDGAVENPVEGTILTVVRDSAAKAVAEGGGDGGGTGDFAESMVRVLETA
ncbi:MAG: DAK2 domain-containing protein, partial [Gemmatimonadetes bacterium]|nr:DAK2 domain-containing protein [Gemmatimonadota bacterium]